MDVNPNSNQGIILHLLMELTSENDKLSMNQVIDLLKDQGLNKDSVSPAISKLNSCHPYIHSTETGPFRGGKRSGRRTLEYWYDEHREKRFVQPKYSGKTPRPDEYIRDRIARIIREASPRKVNCNYILRFLRKRTEMGRAAPRAISGHLSLLLGHHKNIHQDRSTTPYQYYYDEGSVNESWAARNPPHEPEPDEPIIPITGGAPAFGSSVGFFWDSDPVTVEDAVDALKTLNKFLSEQFGHYCVSVDDGRLVLDRMVVVQTTERVA